MEPKVILLIFFCVLVAGVIIWMFVQNNKDEKSLFKKLPEDPPDPPDVKSEFDNHVEKNNN
jgi:hypothetical protein